MAKAKLPRCVDCDGPAPGVVGVQERGPDGVAYIRHIWLCGSCEYKRCHLEALPASGLPRERKVRLQSETLPFS